ncbi:MAG: ATP-binding protein [Methanosphaera sp.]|nr:ATP-binding protein [Methanosphaera sp.]
MKSIKLYPKIEELNRLNEFLEKEFNLNNFDVRLIIEEIFVNIANYSECSQIIASFELDENMLTIKFEDDGNEFNPLIVESPELPDNIEDAKIGGLGIHLVKNLADEMYYEYKYNKNHMTIIKNVKI